ncbi:MAG TPA: radical SAM protein, partial [Dissulfurispiraceae bacterium]|nr:radical SAM protein [Dissulfurispiraceae bacterium]
MTAFLEKLQTAGLSSLGAREISILQVNLGYRCNMACKHCHAEAGPARTEEMDDVTARHVLRILGEGAIRTLDLTGGAPELNPHFRRILRESASMGIRTVVRSNLTVLFEEGMTDLPEMFAATGAEVVASVPYYTEDTVDRVRGKGTFCRSLQALKLLNSLGYGMDSSGLVLNLVYNPPGAYLAPPQKNLEEEYRKILAERHGIHFNNLYT